MDKVLVYAQLEEFQKGEHLIDIYEGFLKGFETKVDQIKLVQFLMQTSVQFKEEQQGIEFLEKVRVQVCKDEQALLLIELKKSEHELHLNHLNKCATALKGVA